MGEVDRISAGTQRLKGFKRPVFNIRDSELVEEGQTGQFNRPSFSITPISRPELQPLIEPIEPAQPLQLEAIEPAGTEQRGVSLESQRLGFTTGETVREIFPEPERIVTREETPIGTIVTAPEGRKVVSDLHFPLIRTLAGATMGFSDRIPISGMFEPTVGELRFGATVSPQKREQRERAKEQFKGLTFGDIEAEGLIGLTLGEIGHFMGTIGSGTLTFKAAKIPLSYGVSKLANTPLGKIVVGKTTSTLDDLYNAISKSSTLKNPPVEILKKSYQ